MSLSINTNVAALNAYRNLNSTQNDLGKSLERLSSGLRINRAADDAAGLAISEGLRSQINGTKQAVLNAQNGISVVQSAEGALTETHSILQRMRTLSVQAANDGGLSTAAKTSIQDEMTQLTSELDRISATTKFNGTALLDGSYDANFQVGANVSESDKINVTIRSVSSSSLGIDALDVTAAATGGTGGTASTWVSDASVGTSTLTIGAQTFTADSADTSGWDDLVADINGADLGVTASHAAGVLTLTNVALGPAAVSVSGVAGTATPGEAVVGGKTGAELAIEAIDGAIADVSSVRSQLGAVQNRFDHTINNLNVAAENLSASESRIRDTDMANEMVSFTRAQILSQAGTAMLAQAKNLPQSVLQLLQ